MTVLQQLQVKQSEIREAINALLGLDARTEEQAAELLTFTAAAQELEPSIRAAIVATPDPDEVTTATGDSESRERIELRAKTGIADFLKAAAGGTSVSGAAAEYAASLDIPTSGRLPMAIFAPTAPTNTHLHIPTVETRAVTPGPAVKGILQPTVPYIFERSAAASLGISMPSVAPGQVQIAKITTAPPADTVQKDGAAPSTAAAVSLVSQGPIRIAGQFEVRTEDLTVMPSLETALSESMQGSMSSELDEQTFSGAAGELNGLFTQAADVSAAGSVETYSTGIKRFAELVDGKHAYDLSDVRAVIDVRLGEVLLTPCATWSVSGTSDPAVGSIAPPRTDLPQHARSRSRRQAFCILSIRPMRLARGSDAHHYNSPAIPDVPRACSNMRRRQNSRSRSSKF